MLAMKKPTPLQQEHLKKLNNELKEVSLSQETVDTLIWLTKCETTTVDGIVSLIKSVKALENGVELPCGHSSEHGFEKQYSSKDKG